MTTLFKDLREVEEIARGATATVKLYEYKTQEHKDQDEDEKTQQQKRKFAVKVISMKEALKNANVVQQVKREKAALEALGNERKTCEFIAKFHGACKDERCLYFILDFVQGGELFHHIRNGPKRRLPAINAKFYTGQVASAIRHLHSLGWVYRDLKANNLAIDGKGNCILFDFGRAKHLGNSVQLDPVGKTLTIFGVGHYVAPEMATGCAHGFPVDWWSLGVLIVEMLSGEPPFPYLLPSKTNHSHDGIDDSRKKQLVDEISLGIGPLELEQDTSIPKLALDLIKKLMELDPQSRISGEGVSSHEWLVDVDIYGEAPKPVYNPNPQIPKSFDHSAFADW